MSEDGFYDDVWRQFDALDRRSPAAVHRRRLIRAIVRSAAPNAASVLDVGCGTGSLLAELHADLPTARCVGAEPSSHARALAASRCPSATIVSAALTDDVFEAARFDAPNGFDLVICSEVLEHLDDDVSAARRLARVLSPKGRLVVTVPGDRRTRFDTSIGHRRHYTVASLRVLLECAGLEVLEAFAWGFPFHTLYRTAVRIAARLTLPTATTTPRPLGRQASWAYAAVARVLLPLYSLNVKGYGGQLVALARRRGDSAATTS